MKNILFLFILISFFTSCKTREILSSGSIKRYQIEGESLINTEVFITDPLKLRFDTLIQSSENRRGYIDVNEQKVVETVKVRVQSKGLVNSVDYIGKKMVLGVLFEKQSEPIYFIMNRRGVLELYIDQSGNVPYNNHNFKMISTEIPYLEIVIRKNKVRSVSKTVMTGY
jgi:hypothetical protein